MRSVALVLATITLSAAASAQRPDSARRPRNPVTPELERTAFADPRARQLLEHTRRSRLRQDSALRSYDAKAITRMSVGMGLRKIGPQRLLLRTEQAARVQWSRSSGVWIEATGSRTAFPMGRATMSMVSSTPIPYFPGKETLWWPDDQSVTQVEVDEEDLIHPLALGAEAYYRYATGDSISFRLPDGKVVGLRELRITARKPEWRAIVGSFWFDVESGGLVRAAYRMSQEIDLWQEASEEQKRDLEIWERRAKTDTGKLAERARKRVEDLEDDKTGIKFGEFFFSPARAKLSAVTVEYALHEGRFWLPKANVAEGEIHAGFMRIPVKWEEGFRYGSVNGADSLPRVPLPGEQGLTADERSFSDEGNVAITAGTGGTRGPPRRDTSAAAVRAREDSAIARWNRLADTTRVRVDSFAALGDTSKVRESRRLEGYYRSRARQIERRREACARGDSLYFAGIQTRFDGALRMAIRMPCDTSMLSRSPDLPGSIYEPGEELFGTAERDALLGELGFDLQAGWGPTKPNLHTGIDLLRYNRIEGLSGAATLTSQLGLGYSARALARFGVADRVPNGELSLARSNGRAELRLGVFHRFAVANDDWGAPLSFGASVSNLIDAGDEGFYYRSFGAELTGTRDAPGPLGGVVMNWRLFAERQRSAGVEPNTQISLGNLFGNVRYAQNIDATQLNVLGAGADLARSFGANPAGFRLDTRLRVEGGFMPGRPTPIEEPYYARGVIDGTISHPIFRSYAAALTAMGGSSVGTLPIQRGFFIGGLNTVRGQSALAAGEGRVGDAFWLGRFELGFNSLAIRPSAFYDAGWAGPRADIGGTYRPMSSWGLGMSMLDGLIRFDASRGLFPEKQWRFDLYLGARF